MESKREQAKEKLTPIIEKALDPMGKNYTGGVYLEALKISEEIVDLIMDGVKEELKQEVKERLYSNKAFEQAMNKLEP